jgi:hypothetical protein
MSSKEMTKKQKASSPAPEAEEAQAAASLIPNKVPRTRKWFSAGTGRVLGPDRQFPRRHLALPVGPVVGATLAALAHRFVIAGGQYALGTEPPTGAGDVVENVADDVSTATRSRR